MTLLQQLRPNGNQDLPVVVDSVAWLERGVVGALLSFLRWSRAMTCFVFVSEKNRRQEVISYFANSNTICYTKLHLMICPIQYHTRVQKNTIPYHTIPYHTIPCHAMPRHAMPCHAMPCHAIPHIPYHTIPYHTIRHHTTPHHTMKTVHK